MKSDDLQFMDDTSHNSIVDAARWNEFTYRDDDVIIATFGKTGTTWVQQIVGQLIFQGADNVPVGKVSPWLEYRGAPIEEVIRILEEQEHRRFIKTHLPFDALPFSTRAKYVYVARDPRDQIWSAYHHISQLSTNSLFKKDASEVPDLYENPIPSCHDYYRELLNRPNHNPWKFWSHVSGWWRRRHLPNVQLVHFDDLLVQLWAQIEKIAEFLGIDIAVEARTQILSRTQFPYMKRNAITIVGAGGEKFIRGPTTLFNRGTNGQWRSVLTLKDIERCEFLARQYLSRDCANWLLRSTTANPETGN